MVSGIVLGRRHVIYWMSWAKSEDIVKKGYSVLAEIQIDSSQPIKGDMSCDVYYKTRFVTDIIELKTTGYV